MVTDLLPIWLLFRSLSHTAYDPGITHITFNMNALLDAEADRLCNAQRYEKPVAMVMPDRASFLTAICIAQRIAYWRQEI